MRGSAGGLRRFQDELRMQGYMQGVREWSGLVLSGKDGSGGGSEYHVTQCIYHATEYMVVKKSLTCSLAFCFRVLAFSSIPSASEISSAFGEARGHCS